MSSKIITIENDGPEIVATNYWETPHAQRGLFYLSLNAGAFRLLVPEVHASAIAEFRTAAEVVVSRGPWSAEGNREALEILFDDQTDNPFALHLSSGQIDRFPATEDTKKQWVFTAWLWNGQPVCAYRHSCYYRIVPSLPYLKPRAGGGQ